MIFLSTPSYRKLQHVLICKTILTGTRCARCNGLESTQGKQGRILVVVVVMTTWLRVGVGAKEENKVSRHVPQRPFFYLKHFLTNHKPVIGILATGCRLIASSSIHSIHYLPMVDGCPVVTNLVLLPMTIFVYHPITT